MLVAGLAADVDSLWHGFENPPPAARHEGGRFEG